MELSAGKTKLMTNSTKGIQREVKVKKQKLGSFTRFKYLGALVLDKTHIRDYHKDCASHCSFYKAEANFDR